MKNRQTQEVTLDYIYHKFDVTFLAFPDTLLASLSMFGLTLKSTFVTDLPSFKMGCDSANVIMHILSNYENQG